MVHIEKYMLEMMDTYLKPIDTNWQPSDFLPDSTSETFYQDIRILRDNAKDLSYDLVAVLIGDTITEEALPTYESWLAMVQGPSMKEDGWSGCSVSKDTALPNVAPGLFRNALPKDSSSVGGMPLKSFINDLIVYTAFSNL